MFPYRGKMSAIDASNILKKLKISNKVILDPFCGSGTLLIEASKQNKKVIGIDSNPSPINIGTGKEITIDSLARKIQKIMGHKGEILYNNDYPDGQPRRSLDVSKAKEIFNFQSEIDLDSGLERTISWYKENKCI